MKAIIDSASNLAVLAVIVIAVLGIASFGTIAIATIDDAITNMMKGKNND